MIRTIKNGENLTMKNLKTALLTCFFTITMAPMLSGMDRQIIPYQAKTFISPNKPTAFFSNPQDDGGFKIVKPSVQKTQPGDKIFAHLFCLTDLEFVNILIEKIKAGVHVSVMLSNSHKHISKGLASIQQAVKNAPNSSLTFFNENSSVRKKIHTTDEKTLPQTLHTKTIGWTYQHPEKGTQYRIFDGSRNPTYMTMSFEGKESNKELSLYDVNKESFETHLKFHESLKTPTTPTKSIINYKNNPALEITPQKPTTIFSTKHNIAKTVTQRFANTQEKAWIALYAFNDPEAQATIRDLIQNNKLELLLTDRTCLKSNLEYFQNLPEHAPVHVFNVDENTKVGKFPTIMHTKGFVRKNNDNDFLVGIGSTNLTTANNSDINNFTFIPSQENNKEMAESMIQNFEEIKKECMPLKTALAYLAQQKLQTAPSKKKAALDTNTSEKKKYKKDTK
ncbi:MAG: phospholipase D-like domain-containing protein [Candidatus Babeliales bacterium]